MIFRVDRIAGDYGDGEEILKTEYLEADSLAQAWEKMGKPEVIEYRLRDWVDFQRTPAGKGFGQWEPNPKFDWSRDKDKARGFVCSSRGLIRVEPIKVKK